MNLSHSNSRLALSALLVAFALPGCGSSTRTVSVGASVPEAGVSIAATSKTASEPTGPVVHLSAFRSPTGNIGCILSAGQARCDIERRSWSPPSRPASCPKEVDFGQGIEVGTIGASRWVCAGDTARDPSSPALPYGSTSISGSFECISATIGMTCTRPADGHGFFLSIQTYRLF